MSSRGRILVVGGAGYIGSHACKGLASAGYEPIVYDNLSTGHAEAVKWGPLERGDILDADRLGAVFERYRPRLVIHLAALAYVGVSVRDPAAYYRNNVTGTLGLLDAMRAANLDKIVFSSTCATYGVPELLPITEATPQHPINPYGFTKLTIERVLQDYGSAYGLKSVTLRYFNAAGADLDGELGEEHNPETHAVPLAILAALDPRRRFQIFGMDYPTSDGSAVRDYVHVVDLADAHVRAAQHLLSGGGNLIANLSTGRGTSVLEVIEAVKRATSRSVPTVISARRKGDPPALYAAAEVAARELGWRARHSDIDTIVSSATSWLSKHLTTSPDQ